LTSLIAPSVNFTGDSVFVSILQSYLIQRSSLLV
jgi:hypothetical protein